MRGTDESFEAAARRELGFLRDYGFRVSAVASSAVRFESDAATVDAVFDPRGEVEVRVRRVGEQSPYAELVVHGMIGRASVARVLELAAAKLRATEAALTGDPAFFARIEAERRRESEAWTAYYAGRGPRPATGRLP